MILFNGDSIVIITIHAMLQPKLCNVACHPKQVGSKDSDGLCNFGITVFIKLGTIKGASAPFLVSLKLNRFR
jgi:hypothetical protein